MSSQDDRTAREVARWLCYALREGDRNALGLAQLEMRRFAWPGYAHRAQALYTSVKNELDTRAASR